MVDAGERRRRRPRVGAGALAATSPSSRPPTTRRTRPGSENLAELVAVAREFSDDPVAGPSADPADVDAGTVDARARRLPRAGRPGRRHRPDPRRARRGRRRRGHPDDAAHRQGPGVPGRLPHRPRGRRLPALALARRPARARGGAPARLRRRHPGPRAALRLPRAGALGLGRARAQPGLALPRRAARSTSSTGGAPRPRQTTWARPDLSRRPRPRLGAPTAAGRRNFSAAAARADAAAKAKPAREIPSLEPGRPGRARLVRAWAPSSPSRASATSRSPRSTSAPRASSGCCCATRRSRSSDADRRGRLRSAA